MIKGSVLIEPQHRKWFASHEAGELHWIGTPVLSAIICLPDSKAVSLLTSFYCEILAVLDQWQMDKISQNRHFSSLTLGAFFNCPHESCQHHHFWAAANDCFHFQFWKIVLPLIIWVVKHQNVPFKNPSWHHRIACFVWRTIQKEILTTRVCVSKETVYRRIHLIWENTCNHVTQSYLLLPITNKVLQQMTAPSHVRELITFWVTIKLSFVIIAIIT